MPNDEIPEECFSTPAHLVEKTGVVDRFPANNEEAEKIEQVLEEEMAKLSLVEREKILFDVHGINELEGEDPDDIDKYLQALDDALLQVKKKAAYEHAKYLNESYVTNRSFRLMFLRSERFDAKLAALKMAKHFEVKRDLFGSGEILAREVRLSDLSDDDMECLSAGSLQALPTRDAAGRSIFFLMPEHKRHKKPENIMRSMWYIFTTSLRDEETQKKGVVIVLYNMGKMTKPDEFAFMKKVHRAREGIPKRIAGIHYCYEDAKLRPFIAGMKLFGGRGLKGRLREHRGGREDVQFELQTFGIPVHNHPIEENGSLSLAWHQEWLEIRKAQEANLRNDEGIIVPRRFDVLFGRGKNTREHTGNLRAVHLVEMYKGKYEVANKYHKTEIAERIVSIIHESHGRFLKWDKSGWSEVEHDAAREKISHFFRHMRSKTPNESATTAPAAPTPKRVSPCPSPVTIDANSIGKDAKLIRSS